MMNVYNGNVVTDANRQASIELPAYFQALNRDFRYQLTVIGQFAQAIVDKKVENNRFSILTDKPNVEVSWQVTGIRQDPFANENRIQVEVEKTGEERGLYLHPQVYGQPEERGVEYKHRVQRDGRDPEQKLRADKNIDDADSDRRADASDALSRDERDAFGPAGLNDTKEE